MEPFNYNIFKNPPQDSSHSFGARPDGFGKHCEIMVYYSHEALKVEILEEEILISIFQKVIIVMDLYEHLASNSVQY